MIRMYGIIQTSRERERERERCRPPSVAPCYRPWLFAMLQDSCAPFDRTFVIRLMNLVSVTNFVAPVDLVMMNQDKSISKVKVDDFRAELGCKCLSSVLEEATCTCVS